MRFRPDGLKAAAALLIAASTALPTLNAHAQANSIFPTGWDSNVRSRLFMRIGYTTAITKTKSEDARDLTGPVVTRDELFRALKEIQRAPGEDPDGVGIVGAGLFGDRFGDVSQLDGDVNAPIGGFFGVTGITGLGTPTGVKAKAQRAAGTPTLSVGYWLDDDKKWLLEGFLLAAPLQIKIYGDGVRGDGQPNGVNGKHIATTKLLPPLVIGSYNFGEKDSVIRPYVGVGMMYAVFFGAKTTPFFNDYVGGSTTLSTKNVFGAGPFVGIQSPVGDDWHVNVSVGQIGLRATSKLVTSNTTITSNSLVLRDMFASNDSDQDFPSKVDLGESYQTGFTTKIMDYVRRARGGSSLGTYVREQKMKITNTIVTVSVGRSF